MVRRRRILDAGKHRSSGSSTTLAAQQEAYPTTLRYNEERSVGFDEGISFPYKIPKKSKTITGRGVLVQKIQQSEVTMVFKGNYQALLVHSGSPRSCWPNWYLFCKTFKTSSQLLNSTALFLLLTTLQRSLLDHGSEVDTNDNMRWISRREILSLRLGLANRMEDRSIPQPFASDQQVYQNRVCCQWIRSSSSLG